MRFPLIPPRPIHCIAVSVIWLWVLFAAGSFAAADPHLLQWKWNKGQVLAVDLRQQIETESAYTGKTVKLNLNLTVGLTWKVTELDPTGKIATIEQTIDRIRARVVDGQGIPREFDSQAKRNPVELAGALDRFQGLRMTMEISATGRILKVDLPATDENAKTAEAFRGLDFAQLIRQSSAALPEAPVEIGGSWETESESPLPQGSLKLKSSYRLAGESELEGIAVMKIEHRGEVALGGVRKAIPNLTIKQHEQTGTILFDAQAGRIVSSQLSQRLTTHSRLREIVIDTTTRSNLELTLRPKP
ncbi:MAG: hypothetical protein FJ295_01670 [Planctomycetes bacterium]|nr:hypothetical protein [Planctomycetota bacterium]